MSVENQPAEQTPVQRASWSRPVLHRLAASEAEQHSALAPDGLGDQLS
ncbi:MAG TPA: hypothetical protein VG387_15840 [Rhizomicrobium sp.]|jgi:hypothetical protein|nr:hypothetical protein [Rhizomicrobium sp.]